jgi:hypothetical protein
MRGDIDVRTWIVDELNKRAARTSYKVVCADLLRGVEIRCPPT